MNNRDLVYKLLYQAFLDIRIASYERKSHKAAFKISSVFHNVPLMVEKAEREKDGFDEIIQTIYMKASQQECESWLKNTIKNIDNNEANKGK